MASITQEQLYELFAAVAGMQNEIPGSPVDVIDELQPASSNSSGYVQPVGARSSSGASGGSSGGGGVGSILSDVFGSGLGMMPLVRGLMSLFGGDEPAPEPVLQRYQMPPSIAFEGAEVGGAILAADYGQGGVPRLFGGAEQGNVPSVPGFPGFPASPPTAAADAVSFSPSSPALAVGTSGFSTTSSPAPGASFSSTAPSVTAAVPQINVTVQAMDARSFLDRSSDIAAAVREAMLNLNSLNDVVNDL